MKTQINQSAILKTIARISPSIAFSVQWERDFTFKWDGSGPNPSKQGLFPHTVSIRASIIGCGEMRHGFAYRGGCYARPNSLTADNHDVNGYLPQMLVEALEDLPEVKAGKACCVVEMGEHIIQVNDQVQEAIAWLKGEMTRRHEAQNQGRKEAVKP
jgi:hypothetical protein